MRILVGGRWISCGSNGRAAYLSSWGGKGFVVCPESVFTACRSIVTCTANCFGKAFCFNQ